MKAHASVLLNTLVYNWGEPEEPHTYCTAVQNSPYIYNIIINPRAARVTVVGLCACVYVCVFTLICHLTHWNHKRELPTDSSQYRNHFKFLADFAKNALFKSYGVICSPRAALAS